VGREAVPDSIAKVLEERGGINVSTIEKASEEPGAFNHLLERQSATVSRLNSLEQTISMLLDGDGTD
jgi:hypothetical protein